MDLFTSDLARQFGIGFAVGAAGLVLSQDAGWLAALPRLVASLF